MSFTIDQLEMYEAVVDCGTFRGAAEKLNKSQPSISFAIKKIEEDFKILLFDRNGYRPKITREGRVFYESAKEVLKAYRRSMSMASDISLGIKKDLKIAVDPLVPVTVIAEKLTSIRAGKLQGNLEFVFLNPDDSIDALLGEDFDMAVGYFPKEMKDVEHKTICSGQFVPVFSRAIGIEALRKDDPMSFVESVPQIHVENSKNSEFLDPLSGSGNLWKVPDYQVKQSLILKGYGWGRVPITLYEQFKDELNLIDCGIISHISADLYVMRKRGKVSSLSLDPIWHGIDFL